MNAKISKMEYAVSERQLQPSQNDAAASLCALRQGATGMHYELGLQTWRICMPASQSNTIEHLKACFVHDTLHWDWYHCF